MPAQRFISLASRLHRAIVLVVVAALIVATLAAPAWAAPENQEPSSVSAAAKAYCTYRIRPRDTLFAIAARYRVSVAYLAALNGIPCPN